MISYWAIAYCFTMFVSTTGNPPTCSKWTNTPWFSNYNQAADSVFPSLTPDQKLTAKAIKLTVENNDIKEQVIRSYDVNPSTDVFDSIDVIESISKSNP